MFAARNTFYCQGAVHGTDTRNLVAAGQTMDTVLPVLDMGRTIFHGEVLPVSSPIPMIHRTPLITPRVKLP